MVFYAVLIIAVGFERVAELAVSKRNMRTSRDRGGVVSGAGHYPFMVVLHTGLLVGCLLEAAAGHRHFDAGLGWPMLWLVLAAQALRWWCISSLGWRWNTQIVVVAGLAPVTAGPYRWLSHPNYVAVAVEGVALPLVRSNWITALTFTLANAGLLWVRIRAENAALSQTVPA